MPTPKEIGQQDHAEGKLRKDNPYRNEGPSRAAWFVAWDAAEDGSNLSGARFDRDGRFGG